MILLLLGAAAGALILAGLFARHVIAAALVGGLARVFLGNFRLGAAVRLLVLGLACCRSSRVL